VENGHAACKRKLRVISMTSFDPLVVVDDQRRYLHVNPAAARLFGAPPERVLGRRIDDFTPPEDRPKLERLWADLEKRGSQQGPYVVLRADGSRTSVRYKAVRSFGAGKHLFTAREVPSESRLNGSLTSREREILQRAADGLSGPDIARALALSPVTVKTHFRNIYAKFHTHDRVSAVAEGLRRGLIE
jgi:PAS domain S-box-containing protein